MNRLLPTLALTVLVALAAALAACGGTDGDEDPQAVIEKATLAGIESADVDLSLDLRASGREGGNLEATLTGPFTDGGEGQTPQLDMEATVKGKVKGDDVDFEGGLVLLPNSAYVNYEGTEYEVDPTTYSFVESTLRQSQRQGGSGGPSACKQAADDLNLVDFVEDLKNEGSAEVGGTDTTKLSGKLDVPAALDALIELTEDPACRSQLGSAGAIASPAELKSARKEVGGAVKTARLDLYVGDDDIVRRIEAELDLDPKGSGGGNQRVRIDFDLTLEGVNEEQEISAPGSAKPLNELFLKLGVNPLELAGALQGGDLDGLLEGLDGSIEGLDGLGGLGGGGSKGGGGDSEGGSQTYAECIRSATSAADLRRCASKL